MEEKHQPSDDIDSNKELSRLLSSISRKSKRNIDDINTITAIIQNLNELEDIETNKNKLLKILSGIKETSENIQALSLTYLDKNKNKNLTPDKKNDTLSSSLGLKFNYDDYLIKEDINLDDKLIDKIIQDENKKYQENLMKNFDEKLNYDYSKCNFEESVKSSNDNNSNNMMKPEIKNKNKNEIYSSTPNLNNIFNTNNLFGNRNTIPFNKNLNKNASNNQERKDALLSITKSKGKNSYNNLNINHNKSPTYKDEEEKIKKNTHIIDKEKAKENIKEKEKQTNKKPNSINKKEKNLKENDICYKTNPLGKVDNIGSQDEAKAKHIKQKVTKVADLVMKLKTDQEINDIIVQLFGDDILDQLMCNDCEEFVIENVEKSIKEIERLRENDKPSNKENNQQPSQISLQKKFSNIDKSQNNKNNLKQKGKNKEDKPDKNDLEINNLYFQTNNHCASVNNLSNNKRNMINYECFDNSEKAKNENNNQMKKSRSYADELLAQNGLLFSNYNYNPRINSINSLDNNKVVNNIRSNLINYNQVNKNNINSLLSNNITPTDIVKKDSFFNSRLGNNSNNRIRSASNVYDKGKGKESKEGKDDKIDGNKECIYEHSFRFKNSTKSRSNKVLAHKNFNNYTSPHGNYFDKSLQNGGESKLPTYKKNVPKGKGTGKGISNSGDIRNNFDSA